MPGSYDIRHRHPGGSRARSLPATTSGPPPEKKAPQQMGFRYAVDLWNYSLLAGPFAVAPQILL